MTTVQTIEPRARDEPERFPLLIEKRDDDRHLAFGWASVSVRADGEVVQDYEGDMIDIDVLERAAYEFVVSYREGGEMHERGGVATMIESVVFTKEKQRAMGLPEGALPEGWWLGFLVTDDDVWQKVKDGTYSMLSIEGTAQRQSEPS